MQVIMFEQVDLSHFDEVFLDTVELSCEKMGSQVSFFSDQSFAEAKNLIKKEHAVGYKNEYVHFDKKYDGWLTKRRNKTYDWCIIKLGVTGTIVGFDIDTSHCTRGDSAPRVSVAAFRYTSGDQPGFGDNQWVEVLPQVKLSPNSRNMFKLSTMTSPFTHVKLNMYPDGGVARFRVYGHIFPMILVDPVDDFDLAHISSGASVVCASNELIGFPSKIILPGRGSNTGDSWETERSREDEHKDFIVVKLGLPGTLERAIVDTAHFKFDFPESCELRAAYFAPESSESPWESHTQHQHRHRHRSMTPEELELDNDDRWHLVLSKKNLGPDQAHVFLLENSSRKTFTHVMLTIYPDGGVQRLRVWGRRSLPDLLRSTSISTDIDTDTDIQYTHGLKLSSDRI